MKGIGLPPFSAQKFSETLIRAIQDGKRIGDERSRAKEELRTERQAERDDATAMLTMPGMRPMAEPPIMDSQHILEEELSDAKISALSKGDPEIAQAKDLVGERLALTEYDAWAREMWIADD